VRVTKPRLPDDPDLALVEDAAAEAREAVEHIRLHNNTDCEAEEHFLCWRVACRHCRETLAPHVDATDLRSEIARLRRAHRCAVTEPGSGPSTSAPSSSRRPQSGPSARGA
jgi:hypothetical protein